MRLGNWLFGDEADRERMVDMDRWLRPVRRRSLIVLAIALLAMGPWYGYWTLAALATAALFFGIADRLIPALDEPEYALFTAWAGSVLIIGVAVMQTGALQSPAFAWFAVPVITLSARFTQRGVVTGVLLTLTAMAAVAIGFDWQSLKEDPSLVFATAAMVVAIAMLSTVLMESDIKHRGEAVIDPLTGLLNRKALRNRVAELSQQSQISGLPVAVIVADLDNFKQVNDQHGHAAGDSVLRAAAGAFQRELRAFDLTYRIGGEEFLALVPGANAHEARELAEKLRQAIAADPACAEFDLTMSFGVAASPTGSPFDYQHTFEAADAALYEAKDLSRLGGGNGHEVGLFERDEAAGQL